MRESRTYGSGRGACHEMHVPTATAPRVHNAARWHGGAWPLAARAQQAERMRRIGVLAASPKTIRTCGRASRDFGRGSNGSDGRRAAMCASTVQ